MTALAETIAIQGRVLRHVLDLDLASAAARLEGAERIWLVGTGTSEHAACLGAEMLATAGFDARASSAAGFAASGHLDVGATTNRIDRGGPVTGGSPTSPRLGSDDALVVISHTTET